MKPAKECFPRHHLQGLRRQSPGQSRVIEILLHRIPCRYDAAPDWNSVWRNAAGKFEFFSTQPNQEEERMSDLIASVNPHISPVHVSNLWSQFCTWHLNLLRFHSFQNECADSSS